MGIVLWTFQVVLQHLLWLRRPTHKLQSLLHFVLPDILWPSQLWRSCWGQTKIIRIHFHDTHPFFVCLFRGLDKWTKKAEIIGVKLPKACKAMFWPMLGLIDSSRFTAEEALILASSVPSMGPVCIATFETTWIQKLKPWHFLQYISHMLGWYWSRLI